MGGAHVEVAEATEQLRGDPTRPHLAVRENEAGGWFRTRRGLCARGKVVWMAEPDRKALP